MKRLPACLTVSCLVLGLAACASAPIHFYTLMPPASTSPRATTAAYDIAVLPVTVPAQVDRPELVVRQGDSRVALLEGQRWIGPLGDEIRNALSADLTRQLGAEDVYGMSHAAGVPVYQVKLDVKRFESVPGQYTLLVATWTVGAVDGNAQASPCTAQVRESVGQGYASLAEGHQRGLQKLAETIASAVHDAAHGQAVSCRRPKM